ncbi:hypothetical protein QQM79_09295 [Marinobacteraceae bacterium S3BR75-40.1]
MYQLVFKGELVSGTDAATAKANVKALFKANDAQIERMFSGERVVIRNKLDDASAKKYQGLLFKQGLVCRIEAMQPEGGPPPAAKRAEATSAQPSEGRASFGERPPQSETPPAPSEAAPGPSEAAAPTAETDAGQRLNLAGEKVDSILAGKDFSVAAPGERLQEAHEVEAPVFEHLDDWTIAPAGADLGDEKEEPPPPVPDTSHLTLKD